MATPGPAPSITLEDTLAAFTDLDDPGTPLTASEVAETLGCTRRTAFNKLQTLADRGDLNTKKTGARGRVWWRPLAAAPAATTAEHRLGQSQLDSFVQAVADYAIFTLDADGHVASWNEGARRIKGYDDADVIGRHVSTFYTESDIDAGMPDRNLQTARDQGRVEDEGWRVRADGSRFWANVVITAIRDDDGELLGFTKVTRDMTERREREEALRRERDLLDEVLETSPVGVAVIDAAGDLLRANTSATRLFGLGSAAAAERPFSQLTVLDEAGDPLAPDQRPAGRVLRTGESVGDEHLQVERENGERVWLSVNATPITDAEGGVERVVIVAEDITRLKEQTRRLERQRDELESELDEVFDRVTDAFYALDEDWRFTFLNERAEEITQRTEAEVVGERIWDEFPEVGDGIVWDKFHEAMDTQTPVSFDLYYDPLEIWVEATAYPSASGLSVYFRDITDRKARERELEQYETVLETVEDGVYAVDADYRFEMVNHAYAEMVDRSVDELLGAPITEFVDPDIVDTGRQFREELIDGDATGGTLEVDLEVDGDETIPTEIRYAKLPAENGDFRGTVGVIRDISERKERERQLREQRERYRGLLEAAPVAIAIVDPDGRIRYVNDAGVEIVGADDPAELIGTPAVEVVHPEDRETALAGLRQVIDERERTPSSALRLVRGDGPDDEIRHAMVNSVPITFEGQPASQTVLADITDQKERERQLARQREQLSALNQLNAVVQDITHAVVESSTRDEIEALVCERLAEAYRYAWIGVADRDRDRVTARTATGIEADDLTVAIGDNSMEQGPTANAARTGDIHVAQQLDESGGGEPWRQHATRRGVGAVAAIPIEFEDALFGTLTIGSDRPMAFDPAESNVIGGVGQVMGHAITAIERKRALASEEVVELQFRVRNYLDGLAVPVPDDGAITFDRTVAVGEDTHLIYGTAPVDARVTLEALVEALPHVESVDYLEDDGDRVRFELTTIDPPVIAAVAEYGGRLEGARIGAGGYDLTVRVPPGTDIRALVEAVNERYPDSRVLAQRRRSRSEPSVLRRETLRRQQLTERQRSVLKAAYFGGFFDWPRGRTGEEVADSLGISPSTFHQHVRMGERKLMRVLFEDPGSTA